MELKDFKITKIIKQLNDNILIGTINGIDAICYIPNPFNHELKKFDVITDDIVKVSSNFNIKVIYPASQDHINKLIQPSIYIKETYEDYLKNNEHLALDWLENIIKYSNDQETLRKKHINETIHINNDDYVLINDYKWDQKNTDYLYLLLIFKNDKYKSLRDIEDYELLEKAKNDVLNYCKKWGLKQSDLLMFFHYRPSYFRLHLHIVNISNSLKFIGMISRNIFLDDVIKNLKIYKNFYKREFFYIGSKK